VRNDAQIFPVQDMLLVFLELRPVLFRHSRPADHGVRLAQRATHEDPCLPRIEDPVHMRVDALGRARSQLQVQTPRLCFPCRAWAGSKKLLSRHLSLEVPVIGPSLFVRLQLPK
jgi:hypothetical protein